MSATNPTTPTAIALTRSCMLATNSLASRCCCSFFLRWSLRARIAMDDTKLRPLSAGNGVWGVWGVSGNCREDSDGVPVVVWEENIEVGVVGMNGCVLQRKKRREDGVSIRVRGEMILPWIWWLKIDAGKATWTGRGRTVVVVVGVKRCCRHQHCFVVELFLFQFLPPLLLPLLQFFLLVLQLLVGESVLFFLFLFLVLLHVVFVMFFLFVFFCGERRWQQEQVGKINQSVQNCQ